MIKRILPVLFVLVSMFSSAQEGTSSPYSFYGLGEQRFKGSIESRAMGGVSVVPDSLRINLQNPAFYSNLKLTTFTIGAAHQMTTLKTDTQEEKARRTTLDYLAVAFPMGRFGAGFGIAPYTSVGYKIEQPSSDANPEARQYTGRGGLNKVFFGAGYKISKNFSIGAEFSYNFGDIETTSLYSITGVQYGSRETNNSSGSGAAFNTGITYQGKINDKLIAFSSATFSPHMTMSFANDRKIETVQFLNFGGLSVIDSQNAAVADTKVAIPARFSIGGGIGDPRKWMVATEVVLSHNSSLDNRFTDIENSTFENGVKYSFGGSFTPAYNSFTSYFKRVTYRAGFRYETTGLVLNDESINDYGLTLGAGLPLSGTVSNINIGFEAGKRGTTTAGLIAENYAIFTIALSFNDRWFVKRKYD